MNFREISERYIDRHNSKKGVSAEPHSMAAPATELWRGGGGKANNLTIWTHGDWACAYPAIQLASGPKPSNEAFFGGGGGVI